MTDATQSLAAPSPADAASPAFSRRIPGAPQTLVIATVTIALLQGVSLLLWTTGPRMSMIWLPGGAVLGALLILPVRHWWPVLFGAVLGVGLAMGTSGLPLADAMLSASGAFLFATLAATALRRFRQDGPPLQDFALLTLFASFAGVLVPMADASWALMIGRYHGVTASTFDWLNIALSHALGYLLLAPILVGHVSARWPPGRRFRWQARFVGIGLLAASCAAWTLPSPPAYLVPMLLLAPAPFILWALLRYALLGACYAILLIALLAFGLSHSGLGPFVRLDAGQTTLGLQLLFAWGAIVMLYLSVMAEQRRSVNTALDVLNRKLSLLAGNLIHAQETERGRIARDLHDDINQSIASVSIKLSMAKQQADGVVRTKLEELQAEVIAVSEDIRQLSHRLHPSLLRYTGLAPALRTLCTAHANRHTYGLEEAIDDRVDLPPTPALALFRIAQEALGNVDAHAHARHVRVSLRHDGADIVLEVTDDGVGFAEIAHHGPDIGLGLISMEERAKAVGAQFDLQTQPGWGTRLRVTLPASAAPAS